MTGEEENPNLTPDAVERMRERWGGRVPFEELRQAPHDEREDEPFEMRFEIDADIEEARRDLIALARRERAMSDDQRAAMLSFSREVRVAAASEGLEPGALPDLILEELIQRRPARRWARRFKEAFSWCVHHESWRDRTLRKILNRGDARG